METASDFAAFTLHFPAFSAFTTLSTKLLSMSRGRWLLFSALLLLLASVWIEPAGSWLGEPDEARYAEIPREMRSTGDFVTPRLNGVPYLEKPPLLYWCNAVSFAIFGETPWAARFPARLAGLAAVGVLVAGVASVWGLETGLTAGVFYLASPLGFVLSRLNVTDGLLSFFFAATLLAARQTLKRRESKRPWALWSTLAGLAAAGAFLTKGLVAIVLPGGILLLWCLATGSTRRLLSSALIPAGIVFLAASVPWFLLAESRHPGFFDFFFVHEHFQRFATPEAHREGPFYYFAGIFFLGFLPGLPFFVAELSARPLSRWLREEQEASFFLVWFVVVFLFFSVSSSKLPPYLLPALPAAAALAARRAANPGCGVLPWRWAAILAMLLPVAVAFHPLARRWVTDYGLLPFALPGLALLAAGVWAAPFLSRRSAAAALAAMAIGWFGFFTAAALSWPRVPAATELHDLEITARDIAAHSGAAVVGYQAYVQGLPWELKRPIPVADYLGELEPQFETQPEVREALFWTRAKFWREWKSGRKIVAVVRPRDLDEFRGDRIIWTGRKYDLVANFQ